MSLLPTHEAASLHQARQVFWTRVFVFFVPQAGQTWNTSSFQNSISPPQEEHRCMRISSGLKWAGSMPGHLFFISQTKGPPLPVQLDHGLRIGQFLYYLFVPEMKHIDPLALFGHAVVSLFQRGPFQPGMNAPSIKVLLWKRNKNEKYQNGPETSIGLRSLSGTDSRLSRQETLRACDLPAQAPGIQ